MEPPNVPHSSRNLPNERVFFRKDNRNINPFHQQKNAKQTRRASIVSLTDNKNTKIRTGKYRLSLAPTTEEGSEALKFSIEYNLKSNNDDHLSTLEEMKTKCKNNDYQAAECVARLKIDNSDSSQSLQENKDNSYRKNEQTEDDINLTIEEQLSLSEDTNQKCMSLEEKLADNRELEILGIMNLSSMNVTDNDIPFIIQKAFCQNKTKCIGLILRDNALTSVSVKMIVDALLDSRTKLKYLSFSNNPNIGDEGIEHVIRLLQKNRSITFLALPDTGMTDYGVRLLADVLSGVDGDSSCLSLEKLYISFNKSITDESMEAVIQILEQNRTLKVLSLQHCSFSDNIRQQLRQASTKKKKKKFSLSE